MGVPQANSFSKNGHINEIIKDAAQNIVKISQYCHVIVLNELHAAHQGELDRQLSETDKSLRMLGWPIGDMLIWRCSM